jgi:hypothetical protein
MGWPAGCWAAVALVWWAAAVCHIVTAHSDAESRADSHARDTPATAGTGSSLSDDEVTELAHSYASRRPCLAPLSRIVLVVDGLNVSATMGPWFIGDVAAKDVDAFCTAEFAVAGASMEAVDALLPHCRSIVAQHVSDCDATVRELQRELQARRLPPLIDMVRSRRLTSFRRCVGVYAVVCFACGGAAASDHRGDVAAASTPDVRSPCRGVGHAVQHHRAVPGAIRGVS